MIFRSKRATGVGIFLNADACRPIHNEEHCAACLRICPAGVFVSAPQPLPLRPGTPIDHYEIFIVQPFLCTGCRKCVEHCPAGAIRFAGD